ncbi:MAG: protein deglycase [Halanaerobiales bacterium]|nr:protein deglycase [Halanaerobiales bacterium]
MKILIPLADGLEEIEAITNIDVLRRAGIKVITAGLNDLEVTGAHDIVIKADRLIDEVRAEEFDGIILPGGMPGSTNLRDNDKVIKLVQKLNTDGKLVAAICAAPIALEKAGVIRNRKATSYPGFDREMVSCDYLEERVVVDGNLITGRGPGVALEFAITVVQYLLGEEKAAELKEGMLANF